MERLRAEKEAAEAEVEALKAKEGELN